MAICLVALPSTLLVLAPTFGVGLAMVILSIAVMPMVGTTMVSTITELVPGTMRGVAVSLFGMTNTLLGATMGPLLIAVATQRSEEHTSELQSLMRISYAVFCLKKKNT